MGIFGAMTTAVGGLRAQAYALENVSGNIANSQTTGFKRVDTSFSDLVPDAPAAQQLAGGVIARSRATNSVQGDIQNAAVDTFMAINGSGYFVVQKPTAFPDGQPVFAGVDLYTRRGDFQLDKDGFLVNGSGYYLMGLRIDSTTGNVVGNIPEVVQFSNDFLPAQPTSTIEYRVNLSSYPRTANADPDVPGSERLNGTSMTQDPTNAGTGEVIGSDVESFLDQTISGGAVTVYDTLGSSVNIQLRWGKLPDEMASFLGSATFASDADVAGVTAGDLEIQVGGGPVQTITFGGGPGEVDTLAELNAALAGLTGVTAQLNGSNQIEIVSTDGESVTVSGTAGTLTDLGIAAGTETSDLTPRWELFYLVNSNATGSDVAWRNAGQTYTFDSAGQMTSATEMLTLSGLNVNGIALDDITIMHGTSGVTQFSDINGNAQVNLIRQNGFPAGELQGISVNEKGRVVATYSNGRTLDMAEIVLASFNAENALKRIDGGAFEVTSESGPALFGAPGKIIGKSLEGSNTDIADEFTKLIITQQAYAANTRIVTTSDQMLQETLAMVR